MKRVTVQVAPELDGERLDKAIAAAASLSRMVARKAISAGAVFVDGSRVRMAGRPVRTGQELRVNLEEGAGRKAEPIAAEPLDESRILLIDDEIVVVDKPPGVFAQATQTSVIALPEKVSATIGGAAMLIHRLDLETSGVTVLGRTKKAVSELGRAFKKGSVHKTYLAATFGTPTAAVGDVRAGTFDWPLAKDPAARGRWRVKSAGVPAVTGWELIESFGSDLVPEGFSTLRLEPRTGRTHQIRVHLKEGGAPILGDRRYDGPPFVTLPDGTRIEIPRTLLHARRICLPHPGTGRSIMVEAPVPEDLLDIVRNLGGCTEDLLGT